MDALLRQELEYRLGVWVLFILNNSEIEIFPTISSHTDATFTGNNLRGVQGQLQSVTSSPY